MKKVMTLSVAKVLLFGTIIDLIISCVVSIYSFDVIKAFSDGQIALTRGKVIIAVFPSCFIILASALVAFTFLSIKSIRKES